jgi:integrase
MEKHLLIDNAPDDPINALRHLDPELPDFCWRIITGYAPNRPTSAWAEVRPFVIECVISMHPRTHVNARRLMTMTALYVTWVWTVTGCELTATRVFRDTFVRRYLAERLPKHSTAYRFDMVRQLASISAAVQGEDIRRLRTPNQSPRVRPYTPAQEATLYSWANTLSTTLKRQNARALLGLAGGAGLTAMELMAAQVEDVEFVDGRAFVNVQGDRPRRVPVRADWARTLAKSIECRTSGNVFTGYRLEEYPPHELQRFLSDHPCKPRPSAARLHSGWIVTQLEAGLPLDVLLEITGFTSTQSFQPYLTYTRKARIADYFSRIIGEEVA